MDKVADTVGMNPIELRLVNAYRDGDMKAHRRVAKNCALIECCQVVAEKAGVKLSPELAALSSTKGGGGDRAQLPAFTRTDENGRVEGYKPWSYARKDAAKRDPIPPGMAPPAVPTYPSPHPPSPSWGGDGGGGQVPSGGGHAQSGGQTHPPTSPPPNPPASPARPGAMRFSSLSGFRRR
jgi:hypothetical protein